MELNITVNGKKHKLDVKPNASLADVLREAGYKSVHTGCYEGSCGACAVMINGRPRNSCIIPAGQAEGFDIITDEGLGNPSEPHVLQKAFVEHGACQCGYCNPGALISAKALLDRNPNPTEADVKDALDGNLCRCTGYVKRIEAVLDAAKIIRKGTKDKK